LVLVFPEFPEIVRTLESQRATALLRQYPSAEAFRQADERDIARLRCDGRRRLGAAIASSLVTAANTSVAQYHSAAYDVSVRTFCADIDLLRQSLHDLKLEIQKSVGGHALASLLTSIDGLGTLTVARLLARLGDPARFRNAAALAS
jgi:transposase